jgi:succinate dehydrogenase/fumarate reductase cytochrome b subunit
MSSTIVAIGCAFYAALALVFVFHGMDGVDTFLSNVTVPFAPVQP